MNLLIKKIQELQDSEVNKTVEKRLKQFESFKNKSNEAWFQEMCFCILVANSKQKTAENIEKKLTYKKLLTFSQKNLAKFIRNEKHRFHNNKAKFIVEARKHRNIKTLLSAQENKRDFLVKNIKGLGLKEASHFLRNTGSKDFAILDRHIINAMSEYKIIEKPMTLVPKNYLKIERKFQGLAKKLNMSSAKLDLFLWFEKTGRVAK